MGNEGNDIDEKKDTIIWIDSNVYNSENEETYKSYQPEFKNFNFLRFDSVKKAIDYISNNKYFEYRLSYAVVSGRLAEEFFNNYVKISEEKCIILATSVYCLNQKYHETKPYFKDSFLNTGEITVNFDKIKNYILKDECGWNSIKPKEYIPEKESYGNTFAVINYQNKYELALPILIGSLIDASLIKKEEMSEFQNLLLSRYYQKNNTKANYLIKPSGNKNMDIPLHLLTKCFVKLYTLENPKFYADLNRDLTNGKFDDYHPFLFLLYNGLNKGILKSYNEGVLYRGDCLSFDEYKEMKDNFKESKKDKSSKAIYYSRKILSFSKLEDKAFDFLKNGKNDLKKIIFQLKEPENKDFFTSNIDIESYSKFPGEKEVIFLPLSCFEIISIQEIKESNLEYSIVKLRYLERYKKIIESEIEKIKNDKDEKNGQKMINEFFDNSLNSKFGKDVQNYYNKKIKNENKVIIKYYKMLGVSPQNNYIMSMLSSELVNNINKLINKDKVKDSNESMIHVDDEVKNMLDNKNKNKDSNESMIHVDDEVANMISDENSIKKYFKNLLKKYDNNYEQCYSIGVCIGNFIYNFDSFKKAPTLTKLKDLASLALAIALPVIKLFPKLVDYIENHPPTIGKNIINISNILNGLNVLHAAYFEGSLIYFFSVEHKFNITCYYTMKRCFKLLTGVGCSVLGNFLGNLAIQGIKVFFGASMGPMATIVLFILPIGIGALAGHFGTKASDKLGDKTFGKDELLLTSDHLYYKYIPAKYRKKYCNPNLKWNKTYLCNNVKSYIIECVINGAELIMLIMNIPKDVYEIDECLECENKKEIDDDDNKSESTDLSEDTENITHIYKNEKYVGDLLIPYKGIEENCCSIDFVIYGINKEKISYKEWQENKVDGKIIEEAFKLSVY